MPLLEDDLLEDAGHSTFSAQDQQIHICFSPTAGRSILRKYRNTNLVPRPKGKSPGNEVAEILVPVRTSFGLRR